MTSKFINVIKHVKPMAKYPAGVGKKVIVPRPQPPKEFKRNKQSRVTRVEGKVGNCVN